MTQGILALQQFVFLILYYGLEVYFWLMVAFLVSSFFVQNRYVPWFVFLQDLVEPPLRLLRKWTFYKLVIGNWDFTVMVLFMAIKGAQTLLRYYASGY